MPIKQVFEKKEDAPEWLRPSLLEDGGKFVFEAETSAEVAGLKRTLEDRKLKHAELADMLKRFEGIDPERARQLEQEAEKAQREGLKAKGDWETREKQLTDRLAADLAAREKKFQADLESATAREQKLRASIDRYLIQAEATAALAQHGGIPELLLPHVIGQIKVLEEGDQFVARVVDKDGTPRIADVKGTPFSIANLVAEMRENPIFAPAFKASRAGGSGAPGESSAGSVTGKTITRAQFDGLSQHERMQMSREGVKVVD